MIGVREEDEETAVIFFAEGHPNCGREDEGGIRRHGQLGAEAARLPSSRPL